jgi:hypothetical protein
MNRMDLMDLVDTHSRDYDSTLVCHGGGLRVEEVDLSTGESVKTVDLWPHSPTVEVKAGVPHRMTGIANNTRFSRMRAVVDGAGKPVIVAVED